MPIYEYQCSACEGIFEEWTKSANDGEERPCPQCGKKATRIVSNTAFILKGGGWYVTDYGNRKNISDDGKDISAGIGQNKDATTVAEKTASSDKGEGKAETASPTASQTQAPAATSTATATPQTAPAASTSSSSKSVT